MGANTNTTITAVMTGMPPHMRQPRPAQGENLFQFVRSHFPDEWHNLTARMVREFGIDEASLTSLQEIGRVEPGALNTALYAFVVGRLPNHWRTVHGLSGLRALGNLGGASVSQIIVVSQQPELAELKSQGAEIYLLAGAQIDLGRLLTQVRGDLLWSVAGGTRITPWAAAALPALASTFNTARDLAFYHDRAYSVIYRTSALRQLVRSGTTLFNDPRKIAEALDGAGFQILIDESPDSALSSLESLYAGNGP